MTMTKRVVDSFIGKWTTRNGARVEVLSYDEKEELFKGVDLKTNEVLNWNTQGNNVETYIGAQGYDLMVREKEVDKY